MSDLGLRFLEHHLDFHAVDGTFMGRRECDDHLPRVDRATLADETRSIATLLAAAAKDSDDSVGARIDRRLILAELKLAAVTNAQRPRLSNPAWYTGEAIFSIISLLLPQSAPLNAAAITRRLSALPDFLADGSARLAEAGAAPAGWTARARREATVFARFLLADLTRFEGASAAWKAPAQGAARALESFSASLNGLADRNPAAGAAYLDLIVRDVHGLAQGTDALLADASAAFARLGEELREDAERLGTGESWEQAIDALALDAPPLEGVLGAYRHWHERAADAASDAGLVTPATDYGLDYRSLSGPFASIAADSYFLYYRSPPAFNPGNGSAYWVFPPGEDVASYLRSQNLSTIKTTHTVHHGSIGHHTQNARARQAPGVLGRIAGTDCACGIALLSAGTMVEGWACYAEDLLREADGFYSPAELLLLKKNERRNAASVIVDINLHRGTWTLPEAERFYRDEAGFPAQRVAGEVVRNSMFPGTRLMYRAGVEAIRSLRRSSHRQPRDFHDALLSYGHVPIAVAAEEMARADREP